MSLLITQSLTHHEDYSCPYTHPMSGGLQKVSPIPGQRGDYFMACSSLPGQPPASELSCGGIRHLGPDNRIRHLGPDDRAVDSGHRHPLPVGPRPAASNPQGLGPAPALLMGQGAHQWRQAAGQGGHGLHRECVLCQVTTLRVCHVSYDYIESMSCVM